MSCATASSRRSTTRWRRDDLKAIWRRLELTGTPSLFAMVRLDQASANDTPSNHYKATLLEFTAQRFARPGAEGSRDYILTLEFVIPGGGRKYTFSEEGEFAFAPSGPFATGGFPLRGVAQGEYMREADLKGLETGLDGRPRACRRRRRPASQRLCRPSSN